jgi:hypothetical protein
VGSERTSAKSRRGRRSCRVSRAARRAAERGTHVCAVRVQLRVRNARLGVVLVKMIVIVWLAGRLCGATLELSACDGVVDVCARGR